MASSSIAQILQEAYVLATGRTASAATQARFEALVTQGNGYRLVAQEIDLAMGQVAAVKGVAATLKAIALNGLGLNLSDAEAAAVTTSLMARGIDSWSKLFEFCINLQDSNGLALDHRGEAGLAFNTMLAGQGKAALFSGATVDAAVKNLVQNIGASATSVSNGQSGFDALASSLTTAGIRSAVVDGYVAGAKVFVDANGDGIVNAGEYSATTDASGNFVLPSSGAAGTLFASGGTDLLTNKPFKGALIAPAGSTVINPLTTMVQALLASGQAGSVAQATATVQQALGLPAGINLLSYDPMAVLASSTASAADKATALGVQRVALQLVNVITQTTVVIDAAKATGLPAGSAPPPSSASLVIAALASALAAATAPGGAGTVNLASSGTLTGVIAAAAASAGAPAVAANAAKVAQVTSGSNAAAAAASTITQLSKAAVVSQGSATDALAAGAAAGSLDAAVSAFTGANLNTAIAAAVPGVVAPGVPASPAPAPAPAPTFAVSKDGGNIVSFTTAGTQVSVTESGGTWTFTSGGSTGTVTGTVAGIVVPASTTLSISSTLASGKTFSGTGTALVVANAAGENLTSFTATGVTGFVLTTGQNHTLTAAQGAIGRIGAGGAAGTLTDAGTITIRDTLAALGGGVAATLKASGADSVIATAAAGDISATTVAGIDSIVLAAGSYTMTAAQAALADGSTGTQAVTITTLGAGTLPASIESFVLGNFANSVTLGATGQNVSSPAGTATTLAVAGTSPTGTWALGNGADVLVATTGANIAGVNAGAATTAENLTLTGAITMTQAQHEALAITAAGGSDAVTISTAGAVTARAGVESYNVSSGGANTLAVNAGATAVTGSAANITTVNIGGNTVSGSWSLGNAGDRITATAGANIAAVNAGAATSAENLDLTGAITMTQAQHEGLAIVAAGGSDAVTITTAGAVTARAGVESYAVSSGGANTLAVNAGATGITGLSANATTVSVGGITVSGTWALAHATDDTIAAASGANITGVNAGAATTAEKLTLTGAITMTRDQHEALAITASGGSDAVTITTGGIVTVKAGVETYTVAQAGAANTVSVATTVGGVNLTGGTGAATVVIDAGTIATGNWALASAGDAIGGFNGVNISGVNGGGATTAETLTVNGAISMSQAQHQAFTTVTATGGSDAVTITNGGAITARSGIESYVLSGGGANNITVLAVATGITGNAANATTVTVGGNNVLGSTWSLGNASDRIVATSSANIAGVNAGAATTAEFLDLTGGITMTRAQYAALTDVVAPGASDFISITTGGAISAIAAVETYTVSAGASNNVFVLANTSVNGISANATTVTIGSNVTVGAVSYSLGHTADVLDAGDGANIAAATTSAVEQLVIAGTVTMRGGDGTGQYGRFNGGVITATGNNDRIILTSALSTGQTLNAAVERFTLAAGNNQASLGANGQTIDATALTSAHALSLGGSFSAAVSLGAGALSASSAGGSLTVNTSAGANANTIITGSGNDTVNAGDGADLITGGVGVDILNGQDGNDIFYYASMAEFISANALFDLVDGGNGTDTAEIAGAIALTTASDLTRMSFVEKITARSQFATNLSHSIVVNSDVNLGGVNGVNTIDLSGDTAGSSTSTLTFTGVTTAMTIKGVGVGGNNITGGSGADTLVGGNGADFFYYSTAASFITGTAVVDSIDGGGGIDSITVAGPLTVTSAQSLARITNVENLRAETNAGSARAYSLTIQSDANLGSISTIDLVYDQASGSTATVDLTGVSRGVTVTGVNQGTNIITGGSGADTLSGGRVNDTFRGGAGNDAINTIALTGLATYVFESTGSGNGSDTLDGVRSNGKFDFRAFLGGSASLLQAAVDTREVTLALDLAAGNNNVGVRFASGSLGTGDIRLAADNGVAGEIVMQDNGKAVIFSALGGNINNTANGSIYYVEDVNTAVGTQQWAVTLVGTMTGTGVTITQMATTPGMFL